MKTMNLCLAALGVIAAGCAPPSAPQELPTAKKPEAPPVMTAKPVEAPKPPAAIDKTPIKVDLSKVAWAQDPGQLFGYEDGESRLFYYANGTGAFTLRIPADGEYQIVVTASSQPALDGHAKFKVAADGQDVGAETACTAEEPKDYAFTARLAAGDRKITVAFTNDVYKEGEYDRNFFLNGLKLARVK